ncbi:hypothetical protein EB796_016108 [Bugula neritina]|uniref:Uncharacterized protein n=1 Tax=Bugula neritina TaxID=10212 RepID=A0A7J7JJ70_BUGNE|nr:hypothetical protein EB796_016108 [Bugula neritina]
MVEDALVVLRSVGRFQCFGLTKSKISSWKFSVTTVKKLDIWLSNVQNKVEEHLVALKAEIEVDVIIVVKLGIWHELVLVVEVAEVVSVVVIVVAAAANPATTVKKSGIYLETVQKNDQVVAVILQAVPVTTVVGQGICLESALIEAAGAVAEEEELLKLATDVVVKDTLQEIVRRKEAAVAANQAEEILNVTGVGALVTWPVIVLQKMNRLPYAHLKVSIVVMLCARRNFT